MSQRSFESINYMLRPNKNVERKLIARSLLRIGQRFPIRDYRYVGFGSWLCKNVRVRYGFPAVSGRTGWVVS